MNIDMHALCINGNLEACIYIGSTCWVVFFVIVEAHILNEKLEDCTRLFNFYDYI